MAGLSSALNEPIMSDIQLMKKTSTMLDLVHKSKGELIAPREVLQNIAILAPAAVETLSELMLNSKADSVRLKAALEVLALAGVSKETKISISTETHELSNDDIDAQLDKLLRGAKSVIQAEVKDITPEEPDETTTVQPSEL